MPILWAPSCKSRVSMWSPWPFPPNRPTLAPVHRGIEAARASVSDITIGFGGGSALDMARAIAALSTCGEAVPGFLAPGMRGSEIRDGPCAATNFR